MRPLPPITVPTAVLVPAWMSIAFGEIGVREDIRVGKSNPRIERYHGITRAGEAPDDAAWCASFVGYCLEMSGIASTKSKAAASYAEYGTACLFRFGCLCVFGKGDPDAKGTGHVAFGVGMNGPTLYVVGGNQGNAVSIAERRVRDARFRWPPGLAA